MEVEKVKNRTTLYDEFFVYLEDVSITQTIQEARATLNSNLTTTDYTYTKATREHLETRTLAKSHNIRVQPYYIQPN